MRGLSRARRFLDRKAQAEDRELISYAAKIMYCRQRPLPLLLVDFVNRQLPEGLHAGAALGALESSLLLITAIDQQIANRLAAWIAEKRS